MGSTFTFKKQSVCRVFSSYLSCSPASVYPRCIVTSLRLGQTLSGLPHRSGSYLGHLSDPLQLERCSSVLYDAPLRKLPSTVLFVQYLPPKVKRSGGGGGGGQELIDQAADLSSVLTRLIQLAVNLLPSRLSEPQETRQRF